MRAMMDDLGLAADVVGASSIFTGDEEVFAFARAVVRFSLPLFLPSPPLISLPPLTLPCSSLCVQSRITEMGSVQWARGSTGGGEGLKKEQVKEEGQTVGTA